MSSIGCLVCYVLVWRQLHMGVCVCVSCLAWSDMIKLYVYSNKWDYYYIAEIIIQTKYDFSDFRNKCVDRRGLVIFALLKEGGKKLLKGNLFEILVVFWQIQMSHHLLDYILLFIALSNILLNLFHLSTGLCTATPQLLTGICTFYHCLPLLTDICTFYHCFNVVLISAIVIL